MKLRRSKPLKNGRSSAQPFLQIPRYVFDCEAYRALKAAPRALLWELVRRHNGTNNGSIGLGVRETATALNCANNSATSYFHELTEQGFIAPTRKGGFNMKDPSTRRATEWRLTWLPRGNELATKDFMKKSAVSKIGTIGRKNCDSDDENQPIGLKNCDLNTDSRRSVGLNNCGTYNIPDGVRGNCKLKCIKDGALRSAIMAKNNMASNYGRLAA